MALRIFNNTGNPVGQFDGYDTEVTTFKGGEVCTLVGVAIGNDKSAADVEFDGDGYVLAPSQVKRPVVTKVIGNLSSPLFLADDGISKYGTLFGSVVGGTVGQVVTGGAVLGPHTATGSGKITLWNNPGVYGVTLDAVDTSTGGNGLIPSNTTLTVGTQLFSTTAGLLTKDGTLSNIKVGRLIEFMTDNSLVTTPNNLVAALNSPAGNVPVQTAFTQVVFSWTGHAVV